MQVNRIQNNTSFRAKIVPNKTFSNFARAAAKTRTKIHDPSYRTCFLHDVEARFDSAIKRLREIGGDTELEMYSLSEHDLETNMGHGALGLRNLLTGKTVVNTENGFETTKILHNDVLEGFIALVGKVEKNKDFWNGAPEADFENSIINRLTK